MSAVDELMKQAKETMLLEMVNGNVGEGHEMHRLQSVLEPSQVAMGCAMAQGYRPPLFLATYIGVKTGARSHAVAQL